MIRLSVPGRTFRLAIGACVLHLNRFFSSTSERFYPPGSYEQAVVTGVVPSGPRHVPSFLLRIGFRMPPARPFPSNVGNSRSLASETQFLCKRKPLRVGTCTRSKLNSQNCFFFIGTRIPYQATGDVRTCRHPAHPVSALIIHPREIQALWSQNYHTDNDVPRRQQ